MENNDINMGDKSQPLFDRMPDYVKEVSYETTPPGMVLPKMTPQKFLDDMIEYNVKKDDIFLVSYPKSGTTWMQRILSLMLVEGDVQAVSKTHLWESVPFLENAQRVALRTVVNEDDPLKGMYEIAETMDSPRLMKTHLPIQFLPKQIEEVKPRVIYIARNPKDTAASFFHFCKIIRGLPTYPTWAEFFQHFCDGSVTRGDWFENVLYWWERRNEEHVFFITYEEMKKDHRGSVARIAKFLKLNLSDDVIDTITEHSTFDSMKKDPTTNPDKLPFYQDAGKEKTSFLRKGKVGDWKNHFTVAQNELFDELYHKKMSGSGLTFDNIPCKVGL